jgi:hypothetical protein
MPEIGWLTPAQIKKLDPAEREDVLTRKEWRGKWRPEGFNFTKAQEDFATVVRAFAGTSSTPSE